MAYTTIKKPSDYFNTKLYTGNGSTQSITGVGFQPDWVWVKQRGGNTNHKSSDAVRGATKALQPNDVDAEATDSNGITSFDSDGFSLGNGGDYNSSSASQVSWNWKANGAGSSNTDGSITSTVSANTTSGFSIVRYTGSGVNSTVGHGLGVAPKMILFKDTTNANTNWSVYHKDIGNDYRLTLNENYAKEGSSSTYYQSTDPTSSVFYLGSNTRANASNAVTIAYCFAEVKGFSKIGSYTGNGNADGTFVYTGFKPAWVMTKRYNTTENWYIKDIKRSVFNPVDEALYANSSVVELSNWSGATTDYLSNGFKIRTVDTAHNGSGDTYIYMAFAEEPLVGDNPATAR